MKRRRALCDASSSCVLNFCSVIALTGDSSQLIGSLLFITNSGKPGVSTWRHLRVHLPSVLFEFSDLCFSRWLQQLLSKLLLFMHILALDDPIDLANYLRDGITEDFLQEVAI